LSTIDAVHSRPAAHNGEHICGVGTYLAALGDRPGLLHPLKSANR